MDEREIYAALDEIFADFFANSRIRLNPETTAGDIEGWDSLNHLSLMIAVEQRFAIRFQTREIEQLTKVGDLVAAIEHKRKP